MFLVVCACVRLVCVRFHIEKLLEPHINNNNNNNRYGLAPNHPVARRLDLDDEKGVEKSSCWMNRAVVEASNTFQEFERLVEQTLPRLYKHFQRLGFSVSVFSPIFLNSCGDRLCKTLSMHTIDMLTEGISDATVRIGLGTLKFMQTRFLSLADEGEIVRVLSPSVKNKEDELSENDIKCIVIHSLGMNTTTTQIDGEDWVVVDNNG